MIKSSNGFTLIEILIAVAVLAIMSGLGYVTFIKYAKGQNLSASYYSLYNNLNEARSLALSQVKPTVAGCNTLIGYQISFDINATPQTYNLEAVCTDSSNESYLDVKRTVTLPNDISVSLEPSIVTFLLSGEASLSEDNEEGVYITLSNLDSSKSILVERSGSIWGSQKGD